MPVDLGARLLIMESLFDCIILFLHLICSAVKFSNIMCCFFVSYFRRPWNKIMSAVETIADVILRGGGITGR